MNWHHIAYPFLDPDTDVVDAVVHRGKSAGVETLLVAGEPVLRDGAFARIDKAEVLEELTTSIRAPVKPEEAKRRELSRQVFAYIKSFYDGWLDVNAREPSIARVPATKNIRHPDKVCDKTRTRRFVDLARRADLLDPSAPHHGDAGDTQE